MNQNSVQGEQRANVTARESGIREPDTSLAVDKITRVVRSASDALVDAVHQHPIASLGVAAGAGFLAGTALGSRIGRFAIIAAAGYAAQELIEGSLGEGGIKKLVSDEISHLAQRVASAANAPPKPGAT